MHAKKLLVLAILGICAVAALSAQQITRIAVIDLQKVYMTYYKDSQAVRNFEEEKLRVQQEIQRMSDEIRQLESRRLELERGGDFTAAQQLAGQLIQKIQFLADYRRIKQNEIDEKGRNLAETNTFVQNLHRTISTVAEGEGYSIVVSSRNNDVVVVWFSPMIDITDKVIQALIGS